MQTFITKAGLWLAESGSRSGRTFRLYIIRDREGQLRWAWNGASRRPYFLKFYAQVSWRGKLFAALVKLVFLLRLQHLYFRRGSVEVMRDPSHPLYKQLGADFALFTGTPGPNRKMLLYAPGASAGEGVFVKIAQELSEHIIIGDHVCIGEFAYLGGVPARILKNRTAL